LLLKIDANKIKKEFSQKLCQKWVYQIWIEKLPNRWRMSKFFFLDLCLFVFKKKYQLRGNTNLGARLYISECIHLLNCIFTHQKQKRKKPLNGTKLLKHKVLDSHFPTSVAMAKINTFFFALLYSNVLSYTIHTMLLKTFCNCSHSTHNTCVWYHKN